MFVCLSAGDRGAKGGNIGLSQTGTTIKGRNGGEGTREKEKEEENEEKEDERLCQDALIYSTYSFIFL